MALAAARFAKPNIESKNTQRSQLLANNPSPVTRYSADRRFCTRNQPLATSYFFVFFPCLHPPLVTRPDDEVLVRAEGVSKKFCRSLKKSLWYGVCDIAGELLPFGKRQRVAGSELLVASGNTSAESADRAAGASEPATGYPPLATPAADLNSWDDDLQEGEFYAVKDVSFELRRGNASG